MLHSLRFAVNRTIRVLWQPVFRAFPTACLGLWACHASTMHIARKPARGCQPLDPGGGELAHAAQPNYSYGRSSSPMGIPDLLAHPVICFPTALVATLDINFIVLLCQFCHHCHMYNSYVQGPSRGRFWCWSELEERLG